MEDFIPFRIGMHYEELELNLEIINVDLSMEKYKYVGSELTEISGHKVLEVYLYFSLDILEKVEIKLTPFYKSNTTILTIE